MTEVFFVRPVDGVASRNTITVLDSEQHRDLISIMLEQGWQEISHANYKRYIEGDSERETQFNILLSTFANVQWVLSLTDDECDLVLEIMQAFNGNNQRMLEKLEAKFWELFGLED